MLLIIEENELLAARLSERGVDLTTERRLEQV
jgi:hypothetical protein